MDTQRAKIFTLVIYTAVALVSVVGFFIAAVLRYRRKETRHHYLTLSNIIDALETERKRFASDIHDSIGPLLSNVKFQVDGLNVPTEDRKEVIEIKRHIDDAINNLRSISYNLIPAILLKKGLLAALREYILHEENNSLKILFICEVDVVMSQEKSVHVFRMMEEIIHNTKKHANASELKILIEESGDNYHIRTRDNGKGFDIDKVKMNNKNIGLYTLQCRVEMMQGTISFFSKKNQGVEINVYIPKCEL